jgi:hypothetical protein
VTPGDSVGAVGLTRFVNLVNTRYAIYDRTQSPPMLKTTGPLQDLAGVGGDVVFDPNVIWDPGTSRFYYAMDHMVGTNDVRIAWGFSLTDTPDSPVDWCHYSFDFGVYGPTGDFPDYPKLGDTADFLLIGVNVYHLMTSFIGSDVAWVAKPPPGPVCPSQVSFLRGVQTDVRQQNGSTAFTPVPADQIDDSSTGYVMASSDLGSPGVVDATGSASSRRLTVLTVTKNMDGTANITPVGRPVVVPTYSMPPSAPQKGTMATLDTLDSRLTNAQEAVRPELGRAMLYTQHTVAGGAGSEVRVYMVDPVTLAVTVIRAKDRKRFVFNGSVSSDREVNGATRPTVSLNGDSIVVGFDQSSSLSFVRVGMISQIDSGAKSPVVVLVASVNSQTGGICQPTCPWGAYASGNPDPNPPPPPPGGDPATGEVWLSNQWIGPPAGFPWRSWDWSARP